MKRIKIFNETPEHLQSRVDDWIDEENPEILSVSSSQSMSSGGYRYCLIVIVYEEQGYDGEDSPSLDKDFDVDSIPKDGLSLTDYINHL